MIKKPSGSRRRPTAGVLTILQKGDVIDKSKLSKEELTFIKKNVSLAEARALVRIRKLADRWPDGYVHPLLPF